MPKQSGAQHHADRLGDLLHRVLAVGEHLARGTELVLGDDRTAAAASPAGARGLQAGLVRSRINWRSNSAIAPMM